VNYKYVLDEEVAEAVLQFSAAHREQLIRAFRFLTADPFQAGDASTHDSSGRAIQHKKFARWWVSFWTDHAVCEVELSGSKGDSDDRGTGLSLTFVSMPRRHEIDFVKAGTCCDKQRLEIFSAETKVGWRFRDKNLSDQGAIGSENVNAITRA
jgi:hypothetical protein